MPRIFELLGYPLKDGSDEASLSRRDARCPFMGRDCDGGGNRYLSDVRLTSHKKLRAFFRGRDEVRSGVCSLQLRDGEPPWIVCPRRLLAFGREALPTDFQQRTEERVVSLLDYAGGTRLGIWPEVKLKSEITIEGHRKSFDYTFDYVVMPLAPQTGTELEAKVLKPWQALRRRFEKAGYAVERGDSQDYVDDAPAGIPSVVEIMTSSTSGGNTNKRTTIPLAFQDAILGKPHGAPSVNYRQVWARMASQLIVKSEVALAWGGKTIWVLQEVLIDYISKSTGLDVRRFSTDRTSEVNILGFSYGPGFDGARGTIELQGGELYAGPIAAVEGATSEDAAGFQDIIRAPFHPPVSDLFWSLSGRVPVAQLVVP